MKTRQWAIVGGLAILVLSLVINNVLSRLEKEKQSPPRASVKGVEVKTVKNEDTPVIVYLDGKLNAVNRIELYAEVNGILQKGAKRFEEGISYRKGEIILKLDDSEAKANYMAVKNEFTNVLTQALPDIQIDFPQAYPEWKKYLEKVTALTFIPPLPLVNNPQLRLFLTGRAVFSSYQNLKSNKVRLSKFSITTPFSGVVTQALVKEGALVRAGQKIGEFIEPGFYELEATVSFQELQLLKKGDAVSLTSPDMEGKWTGEIYRINAAVDPSTQRVKLFIRVKADDLAHGIFMNAFASGTTIKKSFRLPRKLLYNDSFTYVVKDSILTAIPLQVLKRDPGDVIVRGLPDGAQLPLQPIPGAFEGMKVKIVSTSNREV